MTGSASRRHGAVPGLLFVTYRASLWPNQFLTLKLKRWQKFALAFGVSLVVFALVALSMPEPLLCVDSGNIQADALVVLGGRAPERSARAAELFLAGVAPKIIVSGAEDALDNKRVLVNKGVPPSCVTVESNSKTTRQNAQFSIPLLRELGARKVIIVTSWYHSRRGLHCFQHYAPDLRFYSRPAFSDDPRSGWSLRPSGRYVRLEYLKLAGYWVCYGVRPF